MSGRIINLHDWLQTPAGQYLCAWEAPLLQEAVADVFGYHALQLGSPSIPVLHANRMPHRWQACVHWQGEDVIASARTQGAQVVLDCGALPFPGRSLDLVVMPHTLETAHDPYAILREVERVLVPEGKLVLSGLNPWSLWGLQLGAAYRWPTPKSVNADQLDDGRPHWLSYPRLRDWLHLLGLEVEVVHCGAFRPACASQEWLHRWRWLDAVGRRWWPVLGAAYVLVAIKRVHGMRLIEPARTKRYARSRPIAVASQRVRRTPAHEYKDE
ncbi:class I SAM-dependent methyltransferase [Curvibacter sp. CHRR-16]|uniref:class I SAM-dependent methyltransferase n=1 Tax=Curvibacter sp. CHRR-16 TaxID=2835872 RepID=UPI001BD9F4E9|nr:class I SAM-dependent methyltransferase [Curvibacter sp. CHRR-16]MBT0568763.1 class I SAM-dependent methyltransferase [Curvibacter sp. CHRR-16]